MRWHLNSTLPNPKQSIRTKGWQRDPWGSRWWYFFELPGQIIAQVSQNVYDTATGKYLLIPQGTKILGLYSSDVLLVRSSYWLWRHLGFRQKSLGYRSMPGADSWIWWFS